MIEIFINNKKIKVKKDLTIMQASKIFGVEIPHFCFHESLKVAGNCRMCLVDVKNFSTPVASCVTLVKEGMVIDTNSVRIKKAREGVMEFLLINHPLDCPICDQAGECDLQDQAFKYGQGKSRYYENKRAIKNKNFGPLIESHMTRCIHCTRCVRFCNDIAGIPEIGLVGKGEWTEIVTYLERALTSELSGNLIDLCPVGALNSKPYAFTARSWELKNTQSIDVMDALGSNIIIHSTDDLGVVRILPKTNEDINEEWISDKARFSYDGLKRQRLDRPYLRKKNRFKEVSWEEAMLSISKKLNSERRSEFPTIASIAGFTTPCENMFLMKKILLKLGSPFFDANQLGYKFDLSARGNYLFNSTIIGIEKSDVCLLIGANPKQVAPVLNARIGKMVRGGNLIVARIGEQDNQTYQTIELGSDPHCLKEFLTNKNKKSKAIVEFLNFLSKSMNPMIIIGDGVLVRQDAKAILATLHKIVEKYRIVRNDWNGFNILHNHASIVGALDLGFIYGDSGNGTNEILKKTQNGEIKVLHLLGADEINMNKIGEDTFVIYQGHHGDAGANRANVILPEAAYTEQEGLYINMEGRAQFSKSAVNPPGIAKSGIEIANMFIGALNLDIKIELEINSVRQMMAQEYKIFNSIGSVVPNEFVSLHSKEKIIKEPLKKIDFNYYMTEPITRASGIMAKCTEVFYNYKKC